MGIGASLAIWLSSVVHSLTRALLAIALVVAPIHAQSRTSSMRKCEVVHGWPTLPAGQILGQTTSVGVDSKGAVFVFHRGDRTWVEPFPTKPIPVSTIWVFDGETGRFLRSWG